MKWHELKEYGGRIVPGVNTTVDVGPNEIKKQAAKFGNTVDKDGKPKYTMHKKASKNTKPNTLFNLGMTESKDERTIKPRDPNAQTMQDIRKSGAAGAHKDKKKLSKKGYQKHKGKIDEFQAKDISNATEIYVDMDGVLVDFFEAWTKLMGVDNWKQIKDVGAGLQKIKDTPNFWDDLKPTPNGERLLSIIKDIKGEYNILSAPMAGDERVEPSKRAWVEKYLKSFPPKKVFITANKAQYATQPDGTPNILIDDFGQNVQKWEAAGGVGFKHKDHKFERTAKNLKQYFTKPAEENINVNELKVQQQRPKIEVLYNIADRKDSDPFPLSYKDTGGASSGGQVWITPDVARKFISFYEKRSDDEQALMQNALKSVSGIKQLFKNINLDIAKIDMDQKSPEPSVPKNPLDDLLDSEVLEAEVQMKRRELGGWLQMAIKDKMFKTAAGDDKNIKDLITIFRAATGKDIEYDPKKDSFTIKNSSATEGSLIPNPDNSVTSKSDTAYDYLKLGTHMANPGEMEPDDINPDEPDVLITFFSDEEKTQMLQNLKKLGYQFSDAGGYKDAHYDEKPTNGEEPPQIKSKDVDGKQGVMKISNIVPVQKSRDFKKLIRQYPKVKEDSYNPLVVDKKGRIVNGHHRYDSLLLQGKEMARVVMLDDTIENLQEISAKKIGAGALAGMMALAPMQKAFAGDTPTDPLPNKQTSTMVQKDVAGKKDLSKIQAKDVLQLRIVLDSGEELDLGPYKGKQHAYKQFKKISKMITDVYKKKGESVPSWKMYKGDTLIGKSRSTGQ